MIKIIFRMVSNMPYRKSQLYREAMHEVDAVLIGRESEVASLLEEWLQATRVSNEFSTRAVSNCRPF